MAWGFSGPVKVTPVNMCVCKMDVEHLLYSSARAKCIVINSTKAVQPLI